jgi:thiamine kinase-like enzyme
MKLKTFFSISSQAESLDESFDRRAATSSLRRNSAVVNGFMKVFQTFMEALKSYEGCDEFYEKLAKWSPEKVTKNWMVSAAQPMVCGFTTLNHGDCWVNNILVSPNDVRFIDFQLPFWGSPASDLFYFIITSIQDDFKAKHYDDFIEFYSSELADALRKLNYRGYMPSLEELHDEMVAKGSFGKILSACQPK